MPFFRIHNYYIFFLFFFDWIQTFIVLWQYNKVHGMISIFQSSGHWECVLLEAGRKNHQTHFLSHFLSASQFYSQFWLKSSDGSNNIEQTWTSFLEHNVLEFVHLLVSELKNLIFGYEWRDIKHLFNVAFTVFTRLIIKRTQTSFFQTSNGLERVHLLVIKLKQSNIELRT